MSLRKQVRWFRASAPAGAHAYSRRKIFEKRCGGALACPCRGARVPSDPTTRLYKESTRSKATHIGHPKCILRASRKSHGSPRGIYCDVVQKP